MADPELSKQVSPYVYPGIWMMLPQVTVAPFDKIEVRTALGHAIDRDRLATITKGLVTPAYCMVPQGVFGFLDDPSLAEINNFDPQAAMDALKGTDFEGGKNWPEITMYMRADEEQYNANIMAEDIVAQLKDKHRHGRQDPGRAAVELLGAALPEQVGAGLHPLVERLPGSEQQLRRHVLQPQDLGQAPGLLER